MNAVAVGAVTTNSGDRTGNYKKMTMVGFDALLQSSLISGNTSEATKVKSEEKISSRNEQIKQNSDFKIGSKARTKKSAEKADGVKDLENPKELDKEALDRIEAVVMEQIARILNISLEELKEFMSDFDYTIADLFTKEGMNTFVLHALGMNSETEALTNPEVFRVYKEVNDVINKVLDDVNLKPEELKELFTESMKMSDSQETTTVQPAELPKKEVQESTITQKVEIDDKRTGTHGNELQIENPLKDDSMLNQKENSKQDSSNHSFENLFTHTITQKFEAVTAFGVEEVRVSVNAGEIISQIVSQVKLAFTDESTTMFFQLQPENLGKVAFSVKTENGVLTGSFVAESSKVKETIEMNLSNLKTNLEQQGIKLDEVKVVVGNTNQFFEKGDQEKNSFHSTKSRKRKASVDEVDESYQTVLEATQILRKTGLEEESNSIDYIA